VFFGTPPAAGRSTTVETRQRGNGRNVALVEPTQRLDRLAQAVVDSALEVHRVLGPGFAEGVYEEALAVELGSRAIPFERQVLVSVIYKGFPVGEGRLDLLVDKALVVELKA